MEYNKEIPILSEDELNTFYSDAKKLVFSDYKVSNKKNPIAILTGGQPGAGKSGIVIKSRKNFQKLGIQPIILDGDLYRGLYPNAKKIANQTPDRYADITDIATGNVMSMLIKDAINGGYNFIREGTLNSADIVNQLLHSQKGYKVVIRLLATSREESILSCFERYILMKQKTGIGRFVPIKSHDRRYEQFPKTAKEQREKGVPIEVYERGCITSEPTLLYSDMCINNKFESFEEALIAGRQHSYEKCKNNISDRIEQIEQKLNEMNSNEKGIIAQLEQFKSEVIIEERER